MVVVVGWNFVPSQNEAVLHWTARDWKNSKWIVNRAFRGLIAPQTQQGNFAVNSRPNYPFRFQCQTDLKVARLVS
jgi:hypothetical protein